MIATQTTMCYTIYMNTEKFIKEHNNAPAAIDLARKIEIFFNTNDRYPGAKDFDTTDYLPSARYIQRHWGGVVKVKESLSIEETDKRKGKTRRDLVKKINNRNDKIKAKLQTEFNEKLGERNVKHPFTPYDDTKMRIDYLIYHPTKDEAIGFELFYPADRDSFNGCLNIKKHKGQYLDTTIKSNKSFYYVVTNPNITQDDIDGWLKVKKTQPVCTGVIHISNIMPLLNESGYGII